MLNTHLFSLNSTQDLMGGNICLIVLIYTERSDWNHLYLFSDFSCFVGSGIEKYIK